MTFKSGIRACLALCITAILWIALCGCDDLGAYESTDEYYKAFDDIVLISGTTKEKKEYSLDPYFYSKASREDFLVDEDGEYGGVPHDDYVYMAIPLESGIDMDTLALYLQSPNDVAVHINVYVTNEIPTNWKSIADNLTPPEGSDTGSEEVLSEGDGNEDSSLEDAGGGNGSSAPENEGEGNGSSAPENEVETYDDPSPETRIGEITVHLKGGEWSSFVLDDFKVSDTTQKSIQITKDQYILLQFRNNSGVREFDEKKQAYVDIQTGLELPQAKITVTNLLIRALDVKSGEAAQGDE